MSPFATLKAKGCRLDGVLIANDGTVTFRATNASGVWTDAEKNAVLSALGKVTLTFAQMTADQLKAHFASVVQQWLDDTARQYGYDSIVTAVTYIDSTNTTWANQSQAFRSWRDNVWQNAFNQLAAVQAGTQPMPTSDQAFLNSLPQPVIPT